MSRVLRLVAVAILVVSLVLMLGPFGGAEAASGVSDKVAHFAVFGLILWSFGVLFRRLPRLGAALLAIGLGGMVEVVQGMVGRDADWLDLAADSLGVTAALLLWAIWRGFRTREAFQTSNTR
ncbi:VanZ family protein [Brevundimonas sp.]|uniref:VanZ family protein n=1 Tax=Brevundimonas sp. TaxID=1871086 RepID=UPI002D443327|nr:VanZ family protein [Brevundimonas sp.]HYC67114.1 VanZ family protein [Brevundimonas sp.]